MKMKNLLKLIKVEYKEEALVNINKQSVSKENR